MKHLYESVFSGALLALMVATPLPSLAQSPQAPTPAEAQAALNPAPSPFTDAQLDQLLAPIALYPDQLLTQVLMASTFPQELVDAQKWLQDSHNASLKGDDLANALQSLPWDPSVKSLVAFPQVIAMMTNHLDWTEALGTAFADQQVLVFSRVQFLRQRASRSGMLQSNAQIAVSDQDSDIVIQPTDPNMLYVPVYNPADVYGMWPDSDYPPVFLPPPPGFYQGAIGAGIGFSIGFGIVAPLWGWGHPDWHNHSVAVDPGGYRRIAGPNNAGRGNATVEGGTWHHTGPVSFVPQNQRPASTYQSSAPPPHGTVAPSQAARPATVGGAAPAGGPRPAGEGPHPAGQPATGTPPHPEEHTAPAGGPRPAGEGPHPAGQPATGAPPHPEEHTAPPSHPEEHAAPPPHPDEPPATHPEEHAAPPPHPQAPPPHPEEHAAPPPHPEAPPPPPPHPAAPPPPPPHPAAPPPPPPAAHPPAAPPAHPAPAKPEDKKDEQH